MIINHNLMANNALRNMNINSNNAAKSMQKLSSGLRINTAADDAAGLSISEKMRGQINGLNQASSNAQDGISLVQTAEGALNETTSILQRMRTLANQAANGTNTDADRSSIQDEVNQLTSEINRIGNTTEFNTQKLLNGGIGSTDGQKITQATQATVAATFTEATTATLTGTIKVDNITFDLTSAAITKSTNADALISKLNNITSGGTKLSDLVDIEAGTDVIKFTDKSSGNSSNIQLNTTKGSLGSTAGATSIASTGDPTTIERAGLEASTALGASATTIASGSTIKVTVGSDSAVEVSLNDGTEDKVYDTNNTDTNVAKSAMDDVIKDLNASLQKAGLSDKVEASLSSDNKVQFISKDGVDIKVENGTGTAITALGGGLDTVKNVEQVVGAGAEGTGFTTTFQIGANKGQSMTLNIADMRSAAIGITGNAGQSGFTTTNTVTNGTTDVKQEAALNVTTKEDASKSIEVIDKATATVSTARGQLGAVQNRLEHTINNLGTSSENLTSAESRIRDVDMASEMSQYSKNNILSQAAQAMLAQANTQPQQVLQLLR